MYDDWLASGPRNDDPVEMRLDTLLRLMVRTILGDKYSPVLPAKLSDAQARKYRRARGTKAGSGAERM